MAANTGNEIKLEERVTVYGTGKGRMTLNKAYSVHPKNAEYLIEKGKASYTKTEKVKQ